MTKACGLVLSARPETEKYRCGAVWYDEGRPRPGDRNIFMPSQPVCQAFISSGRLIWKSNEGVQAERHMQCVICRAKWLKMTCEKAVYHAMTLSSCAMSLSEMAKLMKEMIIGNAIWADSSSIIQQPEYDLKTLLFCVRWLEWRHKACAMQMRRNLLYSMEEKEEKGWKTINSSYSCEMVWQSGRKLENEPGIMWQPSVCLCGHVAAKYDCNSYNSSMQYTA